MNILRPSIAVFIGTVLVASSASPQAPMKFCELMRDPEKYNGKLVKVRATWIYGFEWSYLHCLDCDGRVWLDTSELDEQSEKTLKHTPKGAGIVNVDVAGEFQAGGSFGHMNGYKYQLKAHTIASPAVISKGMKGREEELEIERKFACGGAKPR
jgi:hypothetical protein